MYSGPGTGFCLRYMVQVALKNVEPHNEKVILLIPGETRTKSRWQCVFTCPLTPCWFLSGVHGALLETSIEGCTLRF